MSENGATGGNNKTKIRKTCCGETRFLHGPKSPRRIGWNRSTPKQRTRFLLLLSIFHFFLCCSLFASARKVLVSVFVCLFFCEIFVLKRHHLPKLARTTSRRAASNDGTHHGFRFCNNPKCLGKKTKTKKNQRRGKKILPPGKYFRRQTAPREKNVTQETERVAGFYVLPRATSAKVYLEKWTPLPDCVVWRCILHCARC